MFEEVLRDELVGVGVLPTVRLWRPRLRTTHLSQITEGVRRGNHAAEVFWVLVDGLLRPSRPFPRLPLLTLLQIGLHVRMGSARCVRQLLLLRRRVPIQPKRLQSSLVQANFIPDLDTLFEIETLLEIDGFSLGCVGEVGWEGLVVARLAWELIADAARWLDQVRWVLPRGRLHHFLGEVQVATVLDSVLRCLR